MPKESRPKKKVNLALQGGGAHGAFAWGVLDYLLEDGRLDIEGICATSAGTMNACALAYGKYLGGREKAREMLHDFWWEVQKAGVFYAPVRKMPWENLGLFWGQKNWNMDNAASYLFFETMIRTLSPYQYNIFDINPLRDILDKLIDFKKLQKCDCVKLFISATHVTSGKVRVFDTDSIDLDVVMASACLPYLFKAVEIDGEPYWDGGFVGNPALFPLFYKTDCRDLLIVHINPIERRETPISAPEIMNRMNEINFNSSLISEMRAIAFVKKLISNDMLKDEYSSRFKEILVHSVRADKEMCHLSVASKFNTDWDFLTYLRDKGRIKMKSWLDENYDKIGKCDTVDLNEAFLYSVTDMFEHKEQDQESSASSVSHLTNNKQEKNRA